LNLITMREYGEGVGTFKQEVESSGPIKCSVFAD
jgi:hypothetical protein